MDDDQVDFRTLPQEGMIAGECDQLHSVNRAVQPRVRATAAGLPEFDWGSSSESTQRDSKREHGPFASGKGRQSWASPQTRPSPQWNETTSCGVL